MNTKRYAMLSVGIVLVLSLGLWAAAAIRDDKDKGNEQKSAKTSDSSPLSFFRPSRIQIPDGTTINVRLDHSISSENANAGDSWNGVVTRDVVVNDKVVVSAGSEARGVVSGAQEARKGSRAMLDLALRSVRVDGKTTSISAGTEAVIAGSPRARNLGAIAGGAAAGALIGKAVGGDGKDAAVGGIIGGATAAGVVAASKGYQVVLKEGTVMRFTVNEAVAVN